MYILFKINSHFSIILNFNTNNNINNNIIDPLSLIPCYLSDHPIENQKHNLIRHQCLLLFDLDSLQFIVLDPLIEVISADSHIFRAIRLNVPR